MQFGSAPVPGCFRFVRASRRDHLRENITFLVQLRAVVAASHHRSAPLGPRLDHRLDRHRMPLFLRRRDDIARAGRHTPKTRNGRERRFRFARSMSLVPSTATMRADIRHFAFGPKCYILRRRKTASLFPSDDREVGHRRADLGLISFPHCGWHDPIGEGSIGVCVCRAATSAATVSMVMGTGDCGLARLDKDVQGQKQ